MSEHQSSHVPANNDFAFSPLMRRPIREDFPDVAFPNNDERLDAFIDTIKAELAKDGKTLETAGSITIAFPQRIKYQPRRVWYEGPVQRVSDRQGEIQEMMHGIQKKLEDKTGVKWPLAEDTYSTRYLNRAQNNAVDFYDVMFDAEEYDYFKQQHFVTVGGGSKPNKDQRYFIVYDDIFDRGSTMASLISHIESQGGKVLAAAADKFSGPTSPRIASDPHWIRNSHGEEAESAAIAGLNGGDRDSLNTDKEKAWYDIGAKLGKLGLDVRYLTYPERSTLEGSKKITQEDHVRSIPSDKLVAELIENADQTSQKLVSNEDKLILQDKLQAQQERGGRH